MKALTTQELQEINQFAELIELCREYVKFNRIAPTDPISYIDHKDKLRKSTMSKNDARMLVEMIASKLSDNNPTLIYNNKDFEVIHNENHYCN